MSGRAAIVLRVTWWVGAIVFVVGFVLVQAGDRGALVLAALGGVVLVAAWAVLRLRPVV